jgi:hypothetical protein
VNGFLSRESGDFTAEGHQRAGRDLASRLDAERQVGDLLKLDYGEAVVVVHDHLKAKVGGLPLGTFLTATRVAPGSTPDPEHEDTSLLLLRVLGPSPLPNGGETDMMRFNAAQRSVASERRWDDREATDQFTLNLLRYAGLRCRILGTFLLRRSGVRQDWGMVFGPDLANFYSGRGMKVYKPDARTLADIVNFVRPQGDERHPAAGHRIRAGRVRYAASEREGDDTTDVRVDIDPTDLLARRTALFGMSRTGKSNTTKIIAAAVFGLRGRHDGPRVGQLILDPNGEYANDNAQDAGSIRAVARSTTNVRDGDVVTYGLHPHPNDPNRRIIKLNFFGTEPTNWNIRSAVVSALTPLIEGKEVVNAAIEHETRRYMTAFRNVSFAIPEDWEGDVNQGTRTRFRRAVTAYRALLARCRFTPPSGLQRANFHDLFNQQLRTALAASPDYQAGATILAVDDPSWDEAFNALASLGAAIKDANNSGYGRFNNNYARSHNGRNWHDPDLEGVLEFMGQRGGLAVLGRLSEQHDPSTSTDYADDIVDHLRSGRLVVVDQSTGDPEMNRAAAERLMWRVFNRQKQDFVRPRVENGRIVPPPDVLVYVEEAHNLLPAKADDLTTVWARTAKEGSKFRIGLTYATQEPSSIQPNILKNTDNWFVAHLNNADELRELKKYYDFEDFAQQILNVPEPGFLRMRTLSNPYVVPVQIDRFSVSTTGETGS